MNYKPARALLAFALVASAVHGGSAKAKAGKAARSSEEKGEVRFEPAELVSSNASAVDAAAITACIQSSWERYLSQDIPGYTALFAPDATRMSQRSSSLQQGREAIAAGMPREWEAFERPEGVITEKMTIQRAEFTVDAPTAATAATALYWVSVSGGARWSYTDEGLVFQTFARMDGSWKITHQTDAWSLDYEIGQQTPGTSRRFEFDYVYPVKDLKRAVEFYTPVLGAPEAVEADRASYNLKGVRFLLDANDLDGHAVIENGLPSGYAILYVDDVAAERDRLKAAGVEFLAGTDATLKTRSSDSYAIGLDPSKNVFVLMQRNFTAAKAAAPPEPSGFNGDDPYIQAARKIATAWLRTDAATLSACHGANGRWFDDTRLTTRGMERGKDGIASALPTLYRSKYDRTPEGLIASMEASSVRVRAVGPRTLVSYAMKLAGTGVHPFQETAFVTQVFESPTSIAHTFIVANNRPAAMALELDYTGYPVVDLKGAERFYTNVMDLGEPYTDQGYRGYWSSFAVFGIYVARPQRDSGLPRARQSNGYVSFWVHSAEEACAYLQQHGAAFPKIPAITSTSGIDKEPGYIQVAGTDSEGSLVIFTEYTGRRK
ncbi:MAG: VOC family protein [Candidatus Sumerlaeota bacterium]|nr:VOC family protein [Candidatus Sumerlaeota bacterium]